MQNDYMHYAQKEIVCQQFKNQNVVNRYNVKLSSKSNSSANNSNEQCFKDDIIKTDEIAYIKLFSFDPNRVYINKPKIYEFLKKVKDYNCLIIDIRGNGGGANQY